MLPVAVVPSKDAHVVTLQASTAVWKQVMLRLNAEGRKGVSVQIERALSFDTSVDGARRVTMTRENAQFVYRVAGISA